MASDDITVSPASAPPTPPTPETADAPVRRTRRRSASRPAGPPQVSTAQPATSSPSTQSTSPEAPSSVQQTTPPSTPPAAKKTSSRRGTKKSASAGSTPGASATPSPDSLLPDETEQASADAPDADAPEPARAKKASRPRGRTEATAVDDPFGDASSSASNAGSGGPPPPRSGATRAADAVSPVFQAPQLLAQPGPEPVSERGPLSDMDSHPDAGADAAAPSEPRPAGESDQASQDAAEQPSPPSSSSRRRRSRGGRNRRKQTDGPGSEESGVDSSTGAAADSSSPADAVDATVGSQQSAAPGAASAESEQNAPGTPKSSRSSKSKSKASPESQAEDTEETKDPKDKAPSGTPAGDTSSDMAADGDATSTSSSSRRRRRRRRSGDTAADGAADASEPAAKSTAKTREAKRAPDSITSVEGSTRIEAKKQRRREGREAGRRRAPILSESEFLARRESVDRVMVVREREDVTQIGVLEDDVLVEHYVALEEQSSLIGNVYLGRVQNVLPSMEAAFIDIGKGRNAVLYAGEVNWDLIGDRNQARRIENALKPGQSILVQVSKDPVGHKGARLTSQISLPGRYLVYVPGGGSSGISRKLPDTERNRLKNLLKEILPDESGVIIRTAAEGASEEELTRDVTRLTTRWAEIQKLMKNGKAPALLYAEPDTTLKVVRDLFTEDFTKLVISGDQVWDVIDEYVSNVAPDLADRLERYDGQDDVFAHYRIDEQIAKALERKVWLPSGGSLVIDRTEAMTVVDVNTGKFTGSGGNLEQTVTKNNLEAAEEIVRQLRLRDIGGIIVIDFIDMVLENNRDLVLRRLVECLGRDRTRHQVAEVTSLGLVQMTRKRIGTGLVEAFSVPCEVCHGRGVVIESEPVKSRADEPAPSSRTSKRAGGRSRSTGHGEAQPEVDPVAAERHSAAAAATAAIAAALRPKPAHDADPQVDDHEPAAEAGGTAEASAGDGDHVHQGASPTVEVEAGTSPAGVQDPEVPAPDGDGVEPRKTAKSRKTAKTSASKKAATAKKTATKRATSRKRSAPEAESAAPPVPVPAS